MTDLREYLKLKYMGDCKCGDCQLVPTEVIRDSAATIDALTIALDGILAQTKSHVDGRDLLDELHPRKTLDIKRRVDGQETWFEGDWLSNLRNAVIAARRIRAAFPTPIKTGHHETE